jgi:hypothetical protein
MNPSEQFLKELKALLLKYEVTLSLEEEKVYGYDIPSKHLEAFSNAAWDINGNVIKESFSINLGSWIDGK